MNSINPKTYKARPYQDWAIFKASDFMKSMIRGSLVIREWVTFNTASLLEMATGSGKTFTTGKYVEKIIKTRNMYNRLMQKNEFQNLNIVVLTNRIDGLEQFRDDLIHGRWSKSPILSPAIISHIRSNTFHSRADDLEDFDPSYINKDYDELEWASELDTSRDNFYFSTWQTAKLKDLSMRLPYVDLIIIDEAHNIRWENDFQKVISDLASNWRNGYPPYILPITATPSNLTKDLFGEPVFKFGLSEYLASPYSPSIDYKLVTATTATPEEVMILKRMIEDIDTASSRVVRKRYISNISKQFNKIMTKYPDTHTLSKDILKRVQQDEDTLSETIVFAKSIDEADNIARSINIIHGSPIALAYHSGKIGANSLSRLADKLDPIKFVIAVDMLNESVDLPTVSNIVFWRGTNTARIYLQQFGRWLRGDGLVRYYDYVGGMKNFVWIGNIFDELKKVMGWQNPQYPVAPIPWGSLLTKPVKGSPLMITSWDLLGQESEINIGELILQINGLSRSKKQGKAPTSSIENKESINDLIITYFRKNGTLQEWERKSREVRASLKIEWHGIAKICSLFWITGNTSNTTTNWFKLLDIIFADMNKK
jgi:superfamily II DNA or RNA helicase